MDGLFISCITLALTSAVSIMVAVIVYFLSKMLMLISRKKTALKVKESAVKDDLEIAAAIAIAALSNKSSS